MKIVLAKATDAPMIHNLMIQAFNAYKDEIPPSSALEETVHSITLALEDRERALYAKGRTCRNGSFSTV